MKAYEKIIAEVKRLRVNLKSNNKMLVFLKKYNIDLEDDNTYLSAYANYLTCSTSNRKDLESLMKLGGSDSGLWHKKYNSDNIEYTKAVKSP